MSEDEAQEPSEDCNRGVELFISPYEGQDVYFDEELNMYRLRKRWPHQNTRPPRFKWSNEQWQEFRLQQQLLRDLARGEANVLPVAYQQPSVPPAEMESNPDDSSSSSDANEMGSFSAEEQLLNSSEQPTIGSIERQITHSVDAVPASAFGTQSSDDGNEPQSDSQECDYLQESSPYTQYPTSFDQLQWHSTELQSFTSPTLANEQSPNSFEWQHSDPAEESSTNIPYYQSPDSAVQLQPCHTGFQCLDSGEMISNTTTDCDVASSVEQVLPSSTKEEFSNSAEQQLSSLDTYMSDQVVPSYTKAQYNEQQPSSSAAWVSQQVISNSTTVEYSDTAEEQPSSSAACVPEEVQSSFTKEQYSNLAEQNISSSAAAQQILPNSTKAEYSDTAEQQPSNLAACVPEQVQSSSTEAQYSDPHEQRPSSSPDCVPLEVLFSSPQAQYSQACSMTAWVPPNSSHYVAYDSSQWHPFTAHHTLSGTAEGQPVVYAPQQSYACIDWQLSGWNGQQPYTPVQQQPSILVQQQQSVPVQQQPSTPVPQQQSVPVQQQQSLPVRQEQSIPVQQHPSIPVQQQPSVPAQQQLSIPVQQQPPTDVQQQSTTPIQQQPPIPVQQQPPMPVQQQPPIPVQQQPSVPVQQTISNYRGQQVLWSVPNVQSQMYNQQQVPSSNGALQSHHCLNGYPHKATPCCSNGHNPPTPAPVPAVQNVCPQTPGALKPVYYTNMPPPNNQIFYNVQQQAGSTSAPGYPLPPPVPVPPPPMPPREWLEWWLRQLCSGKERKEAETSESQAPETNKNHSSFEGTSQERSSSSSSQGEELPSEDVGEMEREETDVNNMSATEVTVQEARQRDQQDCKMSRNINKSEPESTHLLKSDQHQGDNGGWCTAAKKSKKKRHGRKKKQQVQNLEPEKSQRKTEQEQAASSNWKKWKRNRGERRAPVKQPPTAGCTEGVTVPKKKGRWHRGRQQLPDVLSTSLAVKDKTQEGRGGAPAATEPGPAIDLGGPTPQESASRQRRRRRRPPPPQPPAPLHTDADVDGPQPQRPARCSCCSAESPPYGLCYRCCCLGASSRLRRENAEPRPSADSRDLQPGPQAVRDEAVAELTAQMSAFSTTASADEVASNRQKGELRNKPRTPHPQTRLEDQKVEEDIQVSGDITQK